MAVHGVEGGAPESHQPAAGPGPVRPGSGRADVVGRLRLPVVAAPMLTVSGPDLVVAACRAGLAGAFPSANCASPAELTEWLAEIDRRLPPKRPTERGPGPVCVNVIVHRSNPRRDDDLRAVAGSRADVVITSVGSPAGVVSLVRDIPTVADLVERLDDEYQRAVAGMPGRPSAVR